MASKTYKSCHVGMIEDPDPSSSIPENVHAECSICHTTDRQHNILYEDDAMYCYLCYSRYLEGHEPELGQCIQESQYTKYDKQIVDRTYYEEYDKRLKRIMKSRR